MTKISIEERLQAIERRNRSVELDKAWETSLTRRLFIAGVTFIVAGIYLRWLGVERHWLNALVPVVSYAIATLTIIRLKGYWIRWKLRRENAKTSSAADKT